MRPTNQLEEWEWIEAYHKGKLSPEEKSIFEQELDRDTGFSESTDQLKVAGQALKTLVLEQAVRQGIRHELGSGRPQRRLRLGRLTGAILMGALLFASYLTFSRVNLQPYRNDISLTQRYRESSPPATQPSDLTSQQRAFYRSFFDAQAYLATGQPRLAITNLEQLAQTDNLRPYFKQAIQWHLLNAYLLSNQPDNAEATWQLLKNTANPIYPLDRTDQWKVWWQIQWQKLRM